MVSCLFKIQVLKRLSHVRNFIGSDSSCYVRIRSSFNYKLEFKRHFAKSHGENEDSSNNDQESSVKNKNPVVISSNSDTTQSKNHIFGSNQNKGLGESSRPFVTVAATVTSKLESQDDDDLEAPTDCCMSGCPNCVWIDYVEKLMKKYSDPEMSRERVLKELDALDNPTVKAFILMELKDTNLGF